MGKPSKHLEPKRVAIVHDWLVGGGAELVVEQLHCMYPSAPIYTSYATKEWQERLDGKVVTGWLQHVGRLRKLLPLARAKWFESLDLSGYDLVISSSGAEAKGIQTTGKTIHVNYCHAPTHYYWSRYDQYMAHPGFGRFDLLGRFGLKILVKKMRAWDYAAAQRPDYIVANSHYIASEVQKYYHRKATVVYPPVAIERFIDLAEGQREGYLLSGRHTAYKRFDLAVQACTKLGLPLTVIGSGPDTRRLRAMAGPTITFLHKVPNEAVAQYMGRAEAFLFPGIDDFGISAVEAMAAGTPVIAYKGGGALDYVVDGTNGAFFEEPTVESLIAVLQDFRPEGYDHAAIRHHATKFSSENFRRHMQRQITKALEAGKRMSKPGDHQ